MAKLQGFLKEEKGAAALGNMMILALLGGGMFMAFGGYTDTMHNEVVNVLNGLMR